MVFNKLSLTGEFSEKIVENTTSVSYLLMLKLMHTDKETLNQCEILLELK